MNECAHCGMGVLSERVVGCPNPACIEHPSDGTWMMANDVRLLCVDGPDNHWSPWADKHGVRTFESMDDDDGLWWWCEWR